MVTATRATLPDSGASSGIQLANLLLNASGTTETSSSNPSSWAVGNSNAVLGQATTTSTNNQSALVNSILQQSAMNFAPTLAQGNGGSGIYNGSTMKMMQGFAQGSATAQASGAVLQAQQQALATAANVSNAQLASSKNSMAVTKPNVGQLLQQALPGVLIGTALNKIGGAAWDKYGKKMLDSVGLGDSTPAAGSNAATSLADAGAPSYGVSGPVTGASSVAGDSGVIGNSIASGISIDGATAASALGAGTSIGGIALGDALAGGSTAAELMTAGGGTIAGSAAMDAGSGLIGGSTIGAGVDATMGLGDIGASTAGMSAADATTMGFGDAMPLVAIGQAGSAGLQDIIGNNVASNFWDNTVGGAMSGVGDLISSFF